VGGAASTLRIDWGRLGEEQKISLLSTIERKTMQISRLVEDLLTVSKLDVGAVRGDRHDVVLDDLVHEALADVGLDESAASVTAPAGIAVHADADHVRRILRNYVENALWYGAPPIEIEITDADDGVVIEVRDHGE